MSNVTPLPARSDKAPREILRFADGYLQNLFYGSGWRRLADVLSDYDDRMPPRMHSFVLEMRARKRRPSKKQLSLMVGLMVSALAEKLFDEWDGEGAEESADVVPLKSKDGKSRQ